MINHLILLLLRPRSITVYKMTPIYLSYFLQIIAMSGHSENCYTQ